MTPLHVLTEARELVRKGWTQGAFARDVKGKPCIVYTQEAVTFCPTGAMARSSVGMGPSFVLAFGVFMESIEGSVHDWNWISTHEEVLAHFDETIACVKSRGGG